MEKEIVSLFTNDGNVLEKNLTLEKRNNEEISYGKIVRVIDVVKKAGIMKVSIAADRE